MMKYFGIKYTWKVFEFYGVTRKVLIGEYDTYEEARQVFDQPYCRNKSMAFEPSEEEFDRAFPLGV